MSMLVLEQSDPQKSSSSSSNVSAFQIIMIHPTPPQHPSQRHTPHPHTCECIAVVALDGLEEVTAVVGHGSDLAVRLNSSQEEEEKVGKRRRRCGRGGGGGEEEEEEVRKRRRRRGRGGGGEGRREGGRGKAIHTVMLHPPTHPHTHACMHARIHTHCTYGPAVTPHTGWPECHPSPRKPLLGC